MTDTIADLINRINNAKGADAQTARVPYAKMKIAILSVLKELGYINDFKKAEDDSIEIVISGSRKQFSKIKRVSTPSRRYYVGAKNIPRVKGGFGEMIISTPSGVISATKARKSGLGGELICEVY